MNPTRMFYAYAMRSEGAATPALRTMCSLGMMCAKALEHGNIVGFIGQGYGADWPDPRDRSLNDRGTLEPSDGDRD
jgi:hypothetical protein